MKKRQDRRARTRRHVKRALIIAKIWNPSFAAPPGTLATALGCRCKRRRSSNPKVPGSLCHRNDTGHYHPSVTERIRGARLQRAWLSALRAGIAPDDLDL